MNTIVLTDEQKNIIESDAKSIVVDAYAGASKTTTLVEYAKARPRKRMIYVAFNKSIAEEAKRKFPTNVECMTMHSLAYRTYGAPFNNAKKLGNLRATNLMKALGISYIDAGHTINALNAFMCSTGKKITLDQTLDGLPAGAVESFAKRILGHTEAAWKQMNDLSATDVPMTHDGYLKLYQISGQPVSLRGGAPEVVMLDEMQDANPLILDILEKSTGGKIFVGDRFQAIYAFRGAINAIEKIEADKHFYLTGSFRFGQPIADMANNILMGYRGTQKPLRGLGKLVSVVGQPYNEKRIPIDRVPHALIARANSTLFSHALSLIDDKIPFGFGGGVQSAKLDMIMDAYSLYIRDKFSVKDFFLKGFDSFDQLKEYGQEVEDKEVSLLVKLVEKHKLDIPRLIARIKAAAIENLTGNEVCLTTVHKAKGLEWNEVVLANDLSDLSDLIDPASGMVKALDDQQKEELNIIYVAMTRAKRKLQLPSDLHAQLLAPLQARHAHHSAPGF